MILKMFNVPAVLDINGKTYKAEYDINAYSTLENLTSKGTDKLYNLLMIQNNLTLRESIELICCSLLKYHSPEEIQAVRDYLSSNPYAISELNSQVIWVFISPLLPREVVNGIDNVKHLIEEYEKNKSQEDNA